MTIESTVAQALKDWPGLAGVTVRPDKAEQGDALPYAIYQKVSGNRTQSLTGDSGLARYVIQVDIYATTRLSAAALRHEARKALQTHSALQAVQINEGVGFDVDTRLCRERTDFAIWFND